MCADLPAAVLWDMDGTIIDTEPLWMEAERQLASRCGKVWTSEQHASLVGSDLLVAAKKIKDWFGTPLAPAEIVDTLMGQVIRGIRESVTWRPGARELIAALRAEDVPCALVTSSYRVMAETFLERMPSGTFAAVVTGDEVEQGKPHPAPYLAAARQLEVNPTECVVIEDSPNGIAAGIASGAWVIGVPNVVALPDQPGLVVLESLADVSPHDLLQAVLA